MNVKTEANISIAHFVHTAMNFSPCRRLHGHNIKVEVSIDIKDNYDSESINGKTGMLMDFNIIKSIINNLDHKVILPKKICVKTSRIPNDPDSAGEVHVDTMGKHYVFPSEDCFIIDDIDAITSELLAEYFVYKIDNAILVDGDPRICVRVWESDKSYAEAWINECP